MKIPINRCIHLIAYIHLLIFLLGGFCAGLPDSLAGCDHVSFAGGRGWTAGVEARLGRGVASRVDSDE